jgi:hypothetical protein
VNTKGAWTEVANSTAFNADAIVVYLIGGSLGATLIDIAVGSYGSEQTIIENLIVSVPLAVMYRVVRRITIPISVPAGSRLSARRQSTLLDSNTVLAIELIKGGFPMQSFGQVVTIGANTAASGGVAVNSGASYNTKGAYSQLTADLPETVKGFFLGMGSRNNTATTDTYGLMDIAVGGAGSEQVLVSNMPYASHSSGDIFSPFFTDIYPFSIPKGSRVSARAQSNIIDATDRIFDLVLYGVL